LLIDKLGGNVTRPDGQQPMLPLSARKRLSREPGMNGCGDPLEEDMMKYHVTHCGRCGALILCDNSACAPADHVCYGCIQVEPLHLGCHGCTRIQAGQKIIR
jgi:hypothetical protein